MVFDKKEYNKEYYIKNKEKNKEKRKEYRIKNKEYLKEKSKEYQQTEKYKKSRRISDWKRRGLISDDYDKIYDKYISTTHCELCNVKLTQDRYLKSTTRCLDHDHNTGLFRNVLCNLCNVKRDLPEFDKKEYNKKLYHYQKSWGGIKNYDNNLLGIDVNLFI